MSNQELSEKSAKSQRLEQLKMELREQWKIDELIKDLSECRKKYRESWHWNEMQRHFLYLALKGNSPKAAEEEVQLYYYSSQETIRPLRSKGLYKGLGTLKLYKNENLTNESVPWNKIVETCIRLGYLKKEKNSFKNISIEDLINLIKDIKENELSDEQIEEIENHLKSLRGKNIEL